jgi:hypothetical protein
MVLACLDLHGDSVATKTTPQNLQGSPHLKRFSFNSAVHTVRQGLPLFRGPHAI